MGVHFLNAQEGRGLNPQHIQRKIGPRKKVLFTMVSLLIPKLHTCPWAAQVADKAWSEADGGLITLGSLFMSLGEKNSLNGENPGIEESCFVSLKYHSSLVHLLKVRCQPLTFATKTCLFNGSHRLEFVLSCCDRSC